MPEKENPVEGKRAYPLEFKHPVVTSEWRISKDTIEIKSIELRLRNIFI